MESLIIFAIVSLAVVYIGIKFYKQFNSAKTGVCDGGCGSCALNKPPVLIQERMENNNCH